MLHPNDPRKDSPEFKEAIRKEIDDLIKRGTWKVVCRSEVPDDANILGGRFVLAIKNPDTDEVIYKARFVVQGHKDKDKDLLIHDSPTISVSSIRILIAIAGIFGFRIWSTYIIQAYLQSSSPLLRDIYTEATKELCLDKEKLLKLLRPLYGLAECSATALSAGALTPVRQGSTRVSGARWHPSKL